MDFPSGFDLTQWQGNTMWAGTEAHPHIDIPQNHELRIGVPLLANLDLSQFLPDGNDLVQACNAGIG
jgi:hypothetical protein